MEEQFGPYRIVRSLGSGGMAEVFLAERAGPGGRTVQVAVKRMFREMARHTELVDLFVAEGLLLSQVLAPHPNVIRVSQAGSIDHHFYLEMEYVEGADLRKIIEDRRPSPLAPGAATRILMDMALALDHVHGERNIVHGDVNPANMLVGQNGVTKLCDFGVAVQSEVPGAAVRGTPAYMSPEQVKGQPRDGRSDIFSLAIIAWELFANRPLFARAAPHLTLCAIVDAPPPSCGDDAVDAILDRALAKDEDERADSATEVIADLEALAQGRGWDVRRQAVAALARQT